MSLLIDCYNVLFADTRHELTTANLCRSLARTRWARFGITIVCDGRPKPDELFTPPPQVALLHSGPNRSADDLIIDRIDADANPRRLIVVSSDNVIRAAARARRANSWTADEFLRRLADDLRTAPPSPDAKPSGGLTGEQVDHWLATFGLDEDDNDGNDPPVRPQA